MAEWRRLSKPQPTIDVCPILQICPRGKHWKILTFLFGSAHFIFQAAMQLPLPLMIDNIVSLSKLI